MSETEWISIAEAAQRLGISDPGVRQRIKRNTLVSRKDQHGKILIAWHDDVKPAREIRSRDVDPTSQEHWLTFENERLKSELDAQRAKVDQLHEKLHEADRVRSRVEADLSRAMGEMTGLAARLDDTRADKERLQKQIDELLAKRGWFDRLLGR